MDSHEKGSQRMRVGQYLLAIALLVVFMATRVPISNHVVRSHAITISQRLLSILYRNFSPERNSATQPLPCDLTTTDKH